MKLKVGSGTDIEYHVRYNYGSAEGDVPFIGSAGDDVIQGHGGRDTLYGGGGDDFIIAGADGGFIAGGAGDDVLYGSAGGDDIYGEDDEDYDASRTGSNIIYGGVDGSDDLHAGSGYDLIYSGAGNSEIILSAGGYNIAFGGAGDDSIVGGVGDDHIILDRTQTYVEGNDNEINNFRAAGDDRILIYTTAEERAAFNTAIGDSAKLAVLGLEIAPGTGAAAGDVFIKRLSDDAPLVRLTNFENFDASMLKVLEEDLAPSAS